MFTWYIHVSSEGGLEVDGYSSGGTAADVESDSGPEKPQQPLMQKRKHRKTLTMHEDTDTDSDRDAPQNLLQSVLMNERLPQIEFTGPKSDIKSFHSNQSCNNSAESASDLECKPKQVAIARSISIQVLCCL